MADNCTGSEEWRAAIETGCKWRDGWEKIKQTAFPILDLLRDQPDLAEVDWGAAFERQCRERGFTVIELLIVLAIAGLLIGMVMIAVKVA